jgi:subtilisin
VTTDMTTIPSRQVIQFAHVSRGAPMSRRRLATPTAISRGWAWGTATGRGVRMCIVDSGVDADHPLVGGRVALWSVDSPDPQTGRISVQPDEAGDVAGHGTACAGIIRQLAPDCELTSVRVLGRSLRGDGQALLEALRWAIEQRFDLINVSLSTRREQHKVRLHDLTDRAFHTGVTLVSSAHNSPVTSYPWRFPSVISVGSHAVADALYFEANPDPPVDFFALGVNVPVAWTGGGVRKVSGNSFATPRIAGLCALILEQHPKMRTGELRHLLTAIADNVTEEGE